MTASPSRIRSRRYRTRRIDRSAWVTPEAVYGTILIGGVLTVAEVDSTDDQLFVAAMSTSFLLWAAHTFAVVIARHGAPDGRVITLREAASDAAYHSAGFLIGPLLPIALLGLGAADILDDIVAYVLALVSSTAVVATLGTVACIERRAPWYVCILGGLAAAAVGTVVIVLKGALD